MERTDSKRPHKQKGLWSSILYFFPFQLLILHLKKNHLLIIFWLLLFGYISGALANKYGVSFLFLYPEYLGEVGFWSHFLIGFVLGGFVMAFNIYTYVIHAYRFPFLATLSTPFYKFCLNNFLIPGFFLAFYLWEIIAFQRAIEFESAADIGFHVTGLLFGFFVFMFFSLVYFRGTNKDIFIFVKSNKEERRKGRFYEFYDKFVREQIRQSSKRMRQRPWRVESYFRSPFSIALARESDHYKKETLRQVFRQNHFNASLFEVGLVISFLIIMNFGELPIFTIPGGASVILVFTLMLMILSILLSWFRGWAITVLVILVLVANHYSNDLRFLPQQNALYGLDYQNKPVPYSEEQLLKLVEDGQHLVEQRQTMEATLGKWRAKQDAEKPKLLIVNVSGGGLRSALWTTSILSHVDSLLQGRLMERTALMSGASGGMLGLAYLRECYYSDQTGPLYAKRDAMEQAISRDILNPVLLSIASTDLLFQLGRFEYDGKAYPKDRAYRFEKQWLENTEGGLDRALSEYRQPETDAEIPMLILYPTIINDGRKLLVSPMDLTFMTLLPDEHAELIDHQFDFVEFRSLFKDHGADDARFTSLLRANATFPYILPQVSLPSEPTMQLMDAGIRDNFGFTVSFRFIASMQQWIEENTSGVVILQVRDKRKDVQGEVDSQRILSRLTSPLGNVYGNFIKSQDFVHDELYASTRKWLKVPLDQVILQMQQPGEENVSMSWHLTALEKRQIEESVYSKENRQSIQRLIQLLDAAPPPVAERD
ncbi:MAG: patatin-like phospholipase family protein [Flavobacteriales bacterium]|nr:patatin-like phospholipase family protein [Flavobacteriales bacterium]